MVLPVLTILRTVRITMAAARASRPTFACMHTLFIENVSCRKCFMSERENASLGNGGESSQLHSDEVKLQVTWQVNSCCPVVKDSSEYSGVTATSSTVMTTSHDRLQVTCQVKCRLSAVGNYLKATEGTVTSPTAMMRSDHKAQANEVSKTNKPALTWQVDSY